MINVPWVLHDAYMIIHMHVYTTKTSLLQICYKVGIIMYYDIFNQTYARLITETFKLNMLNIHGIYKNL